MSEFVSPNLPQETIVVIDDTEFIIELLQRVLEEIGYRVEGVLVNAKKNEPLKSVIKRLRRQDLLRADNFIVDFVMGQVTGDQVVRALRAAEKSKSPHEERCFILGNSDSGNKNAFLRAGADGFMAKPHDFIMLQSVFGLSDEDGEKKREDARASIARAIAEKASPTPRGEAQKDEPLFIDTPIEQDLTEQEILDACPFLLVVKTESGGEITIDFFIDNKGSSNIGNGLRGIVRQNNVCLHPKDKSLLLSNIYGITRGETIKIMIDYEKAAQGNVHGILELPIPEQGGLFRRDTNPALEPGNPS